MTTSTIPTRRRRASRRLRRAGRALIALVAVAAAVPPTGHPASSASTALWSVAAVFDGKTLQGIPAKVRGGITELSLTDTGTFAVDPQLVRIRGARPTLHLPKH